MMRETYHQLLLSGDEEALAELLSEASQKEIDMIAVDLRLTANILIDADNHFLRLFGGAYLDDAGLPFGQHVCESQVAENDLLRWFGEEAAA